MRLDARNGDRLRLVWHAEQCRRISRCVWLDDEMPAWGESTGKVIYPNGGIGEIEVVEYRARKIVFGDNWAVINPVEDADEAPAQTVQLERVA